jgi:hypothetical protein
MDHLAQIRRVDPGEIDAWNRKEIIVDGRIHALVGGHPPRRLREAAVDRQTGADDSG